MVVWRMVSPSGLMTGETNSNSKIIVPKLLPTPSPILLREESAITATPTRKFSSSSSIQYYSSTKKNAENNSSVLLLNQDSAKRPVKRSAPFDKHKFYLDIKSKTSVSKKLVEDIKLLGGVIDDFFSREISTVISDAPDWKLKASVGGSNASTAAQSPSTPLSFQNSPLTWSPLASEDLQKKPLQTKSRVDTLLERARASRSTPASGDVIENAQKWGLKVWSLSKVLIWIENYKTKRSQEFSPVYKHTRSHSLDSSAKRILKGSYIKFESKTKSFRPVSCELESFPRLYFDGKLGASPFLPVSAYSSDRKKSKKTTANETKVKPVDNKKGGYCEICELNFTNLSSHILSKDHVEKIKSSEYWKQVDDSISKIKTC